MVRLSRRERERELHRREVLAAAEAVFAEKGYHNATMQEIAQRAEFAVGTIYNMFESKRAIYYDLVEQRAREYLDRVRERISKLSDPRAQVRAIIEAKLAFFEENTPLFEIFRRSTSDGQEQRPSGVSEQGRRIYAEYVRMVSDVFARGIREEIFTDGDPVLLTLAVEGVTNALIVHSFHTGGRKLEGVTPELIERLLFHGILAKRERGS